MPYTGICPTYLESFMKSFHWYAVIAAGAMLKKGKIRELRAIQAAFPYFNRDTRNVRNKKPAINCMNTDFMKQM